MIRPTLHCGIRCPRRRLIQRPRDVFRPRQINSGRVVKSRKFCKSKWGIKTQDQRKKRTNHHFTWRSLRENLTISRSSSPKQNHPWYAYDVLPQSAERQINPLLPSWAHRHTCEFTRDDQQVSQSIRLLRREGSRGGSLSSPSSRIDNRQNTTRHCPSVSPYPVGGRSIN